ncbi:MAG: patatin-like phospholipase family protein [Chlorobiaceae bacterium]
MRILSIDGGGILGIIPGQVLISLEQKLQQISGNADMRIADAFDLIAGTSTGGILTCLYLCPDKATGRPKFSAKEAVALYLQNGDNIFDVSIFKNIESLGGMTDEKYSADTLEKVLKDYLGDMKLSDLLKPCLIPAYDITRRKAQFFNSADVAKKGSEWDFYLHDVARGTSAAPTYFEPANISSLGRTVYPLVDGGLFANNPAMCACIEAFSMNPELKVSDLKVLSLGTGDADKSYHYSEAKNWGKLNWLLPVLDILTSAGAETVDYQIQKLFSSAGCSEQHLRLQIDLGAFSDVDGAFDNASEGNMSALERAGKALAESSDDKLTVFANMLLEV